MSDRILASLWRLGEATGAVRVEDVFDIPIGDLWLAITDPERLGHWIATVEGDLRVGGRVRARFTRSSGWEGEGRIGVCEAPRHLVITWEPGTPDEGVQEATLTPAGDGTRLVIEERGTRFEGIEWYGAGWQAHVEDLGAYLSGQPTGDWASRVRQLAPAYKKIADGLVLG